MSHTHKHKHMHTHTCTHTQRERERERVHAERISISPPLPHNSFLFYSNHNKPSCLKTNANANANTRVFAEEQKHQIHNCLVNQLWQNGNWITQQQIIFHIKEIKTESSHTGANTHTYTHLCMRALRLSGQSGTISSWWKMRAGGKTAQEKVTVRQTEWWEQ